MIVTISGLPGSGTSTVASLLSEAMDIPVLSAGDTFRELAEEQGMNLSDFGRKAEGDHSVDKALDERMMQRAKEGDVILEGRMAGIMTDIKGIEAFRIWISGPLLVRCQRIMERESKVLDTVMVEVKRREESERLRYKTIYGADIRNLDVYDLVIDSSSKLPEVIVKEIMGAVDAE